VEVRNGIRLFPVREGAGTITPEVVRALMEETDEPLSVGLQHAAGPAAIALIDA
jgi:hypothetical protein